jgi:phosphate transport system substrate-binding protein
MMKRTQGRQKIRVSRASAFLVSAALWASAGSAAAQPANLAPEHGLDPALTAYAPVNRLAGRVSLAGSNTMAPLMTKLVAHFTREHPDTKFGVESVPNAQAIREFLLGISYQRRGDKVNGVGTEGASHAALLMSSRPLSEQERKGFAFNHGYEPLEIAIAMDAVAVYVNKENPITGLTLEQVDAIFSTAPHRGMQPVSTWGQVGLQNTWSPQPIHVYGTETTSGTRYFFEHMALLGGKLKSSVQEKPGAASEILAIAQDRLAIGYAGSGYNTSFVRMVPLADHAGGQYIHPSAESVQSHSYPLARPLFLYVNKNPKDKFDPVVEEFLKFVYSRQGQEVAARANFYPLTSAQVAENRQKLGLADNVAQAAITTSPNIR